MSWTFGQDEDGSTHHIYAYEIYNEDSNELIRRGGGTMSPNGTSVSLGLNSSVVQEMESGNYFFEIYAWDDTRTQQLSERVRSDTKSFTRPSASLPVPENPRWDGTKIYWDYPETNSGQVGDSVHVQLFYCDTEDGKYTKVRESTPSYQRGKDMRHYGMEEAGYYKFKIEVFSADIQSILPSGFSEYSEATYYPGSQ